MDRPVHLTLVAEGHAQVKVGFGEIRLPANGFLVLADRLVHCPVLARSMPRLSRDFTSSGRSRRAS